MMIDTKTKDAVEFKPMAIPKKYRVVGFFFLRGVPRASSLEDFKDLLDMRWSLTQLQSDVQGGVLHPGTIIETPKGELRIVIKQRTSFALMKFKSTIGDENVTITTHFNP